MRSGIHDCAFERSAGLEPGMPPSRAALQFMSLYKPMKWAPSFSPRRASRGTRKTPMNSTPAREAGGIGNAMSHAHILIASLKGIPDAARFTGSGEISSCGR